MPVGVQLLFFFVFSISLHYTFEYILIYVIMERIYKDIVYRCIIRKIITIYFYIFRMIMLRCKKNERGVVFSINILKHKTYIFKGGVFL